MYTQATAVAVKGPSKKFKIFNIVDSVVITLYEQSTIGSNVTEFWVSVSHTSLGPGPTVSSITSLIGLTGVSIGTFTVPNTSNSIIYGVHGFATKYTPNLLRFVTNKSMPYPGSTFGGTNVYLGWSPGINYDTMQLVPATITGPALVSSFLSRVTWISRVYTGNVKWLLDVNPAIINASNYASVVNTVPFTGTMVDLSTYYMTSLYASGIQSWTRYPTVYQYCPPCGP